MAPQHSYSPSQAAADARPTGPSLRAATRQADPGLTLKRNGRPPLAAAQILMCQVEVQRPSMSVHSTSMVSQLAPRRSSSYPEEGAGGMRDAPEAWDPLSLHHPVTTAAFALAEPQRHPLACRRQLRSSPASKHPDPPSRRSGRQTAGVHASPECEQALHLWPVHENARTRSPGLPGVRPKHPVHQ